MRTCKITAGKVVVEAEVLDNATADAIWEAMPIQARGTTWGDEIYFGIPVELGEDDAQAVVELGDLGYWPPGNALCIFYGPTPASTGSEIWPASPVNVWGRVLGDAKVFKGSSSGVKVIVERA
jgi:uncharacterized protein